MSTKAYLALLSTFFAIFSLTSANIDASHGVSHFSRHKRLGRQLHSAANSTLGDATVVPATTTSPVPEVSEALKQLVPVTETAAPTSAPNVQPVDSGTSSDISTMSTRRIQSIIDSLTDGANIERVAALGSWFLTLGADGQWPAAEVDYTRGCEAQRANWPIQEHWRRILVLAGAWHGGLKGTEQYVKNSDVRAAISRAMDWWVANDFTTLECIDKGGNAACPCETPGLWNRNWFSNIILIPELVAQTCLLLNDSLTSSQASFCSSISLRSYNTFTRRPTFLTGANTLDVAKIGIDLAILTGDSSLLADAYNRVHLELVIQDKPKADGIRADGSFSQHLGLVYSGNYGKDFVTDLLGFELLAAGTQFAANSEQQATFAALFDGGAWMIYRNVITGINHWDFSVLGRFISFHVKDAQQVYAWASSNIKIPLPEVQALGEQWENNVLKNFASSLSTKTDNANAGQLYGNRMFYANDYMVHRGKNYVTTTRMYSNRTINSECVNSQNPLGFHLSDGTVYTRVKGDEYEDIAASWDWNLIPGTTVDYAVTPLHCNTTKATGVEAFVGGVTTEQVGIAAMRYTNPVGASLKWQKTWFFLENDIQLVMVSDISSTTSASVRTVLDQRRHGGEIIVNGAVQASGKSSVPGALSLWHGNVGYVFPESTAVALHLEVGEKGGNWSTIGISSQPPSIVDLFAAFLEHKDLNTPIFYIVLPGVDKDAFAKKIPSLPIDIGQNDKHVSAVYDSANDVIMAVFWNVNGGTVTIKPKGCTPITITSDGNTALVFNHKDGKITVADPSQSLERLNISIKVHRKRKLLPDLIPHTRKITFELPSGAFAGSSTTKTFKCLTRNAYADATD
ncbi:polysaccharide lyase family 8 protein [Pleurotus eryngii]|uniref:Polysaccharide lyase family 8 protein n=1 Tax=Pleurotus eryngii TaxID=5323 RepID=A0A9P5ZKX1_PLEER|nr:polysaccharide lyase family 8 protein [Pleurotus eryngii]